MRAVIWALLLAAAARAHRVDEYLQAATVAVEPDRVRITLRLVPGQGVAPALLSAVDKEGPRAYVNRVLADLSLTLDGMRLAPRLTAVEISPREELLEGTGLLQLELEARVVSRTGERRLIFENRHQAGSAVYLMNCLIPRDPRLLIVDQKRDPAQASFEVRYRQTSSGHP